MNILIHQSNERYASLQKVLKDSGQNAASWDPNAFPVDKVVSEFKPDIVIFNENMDSNSFQYLLNIKDVLKVVQTDNPINTGLIVRISDNSDLKYGTYGNLEVFRNAKVQDHLKSDVCYYGPLSTESLAITHEEGWVQVFHETLWPYPFYCGQISTEMRANAYRSSKRCPRFKFDDECINIILADGKLDLTSITDAPDDFVNNPLEYALSHTVHDWAKNIFEKLGSKKIVSAIQKDRLDKINAANI